MADIIHTLGELFVVLGKLVVELLAFGLQWLLLIFWIAWWLAAVNWKKAWPVLANGGWVAVMVLTVIGAFVWSQLAPSTPTIAGLVLPTFWWQLGASALIVGSALFAGWLQGVLGWTPAEIELEPPVHDDHGSADSPSGAGTNGEWASSVIIGTAAHQLDHDEPGVYIL